MGGGGSGQSICGIGWEWSEYLWDWEGVVEVSVCVSGRSICGIGRAWLEYLWEWEGMVGISVRVGGNGQSICRSGWVWSENLWEWECTCFSANPVILNGKALKICLTFMGKWQTKHEGLDVRSYNEQNQESP